MLSLIFGGVTFGFGLGLVYREGYTTGGTDIINKLLNKYFYTTMGSGMLLIEGIIVLISGFVFGINTGLRVSDLSYYFPFKCVCSCHFYLSFMNNLF